MTKSKSFVSKFFNKEIKVEIDNEWCFPYHPDTMDRVERLTGLPWPEDILKKKRDEEKRLLEHLSI